MIDGIKIQITGISMPALKSNSLLEFSAPVELNTGELQPTYIAKYKNLNLAVKSENYITLQGSLHKYWDNGVNSSDFTYNDFCAAIDQICKDLAVMPSQLHILRMEFGVNVMLNFAPQLLLSRLLCYGYKPLNAMNNGIGKQCVLHQYAVKIYSKLLQGVTEQNILRVEYKVTKMQNLKNKVRTVSDLLHLETWTWLGGKLIQTLTKLLWFDFGIDYQNYKGSERDFIIEARNPLFWEGLNRQRAHDCKARLLKIFQSKGNEIYFKSLFELAECKLKVICGADIFTDSRKQVEPQIKGHFYPLDKEELGHRYCKSCGRDISNQRSNSKFCSESKYGNQGKRCRNRASNPINNRKRKISKILRIGVLFDIEPYFAVSNP